MGGQGKGEGERRERDRGRERSRRLSRGRAIVNLRNRTTKYVGAGSGCDCWDLPCTILRKLLNISVPTVPQSEGRSNTLFRGLLGGFNIVNVSCVKT